jgi:hypothetical protein
LNISIISEKIGDRNILSYLEDKELKFDLFANFLAEFEEY